MEDFEKSAYLIASELLETAEGGEILVVGCSTSEVEGEKIGTASDISAAEKIYEGIKKAADEKNVFIAAQCCEHLNRALIVEKELAERERLLMVNVRPVKKAGGSFATVCYEKFLSPCAVEFIRADFGMDIGLTLIGMHLKHVAVPYRTKCDKIGEAKVTAARTRLKYIGGPRAQYEDQSFSSPR